MSEKKTSGLKWKSIVKLIVFVTLTFACIFFVNHFLKPKYYYNQMWPSTNTAGDFYRLKRNSVDVLFLGSSHVMSSFNPQVIYDNYGIVSYNLGSEQQSLLTSYYWLREALKYQKPKVVVLDTYLLFLYANAETTALNCSEASVRKAFDGMRPSLLKWQAARDIQKNDPDQDALSFFFLNMRYHNRWSYLTDTDYTEYTMVDHGGVKGFTTLGGQNDNVTYTPFDDAEINKEWKEDMVELSADYLGRIEELCNQNGIKLILVKIPCSEPYRRYNTTKEYAESHGLDFYDFNEKKLYEEIDYDASADLLAHPNYHGAEKLSLYMGRVLAEDYGVAPREDDSYNKSRETYNHKVAAEVLAETTEFSDFLDKIDQERYTVFVYAPLSVSSVMNETRICQMGQLGFKENLLDVPVGTHYCALKNNGEVKEILTDGPVDWAGSICKGALPYDFSIAGSSCSFTVGKTEYGGANEGVLFVVYDEDLKMIVDKVTFRMKDEVVVSQR